MADKEITSVVIMRMARTIAVGHGSPRSPTHPTASAKIQAMTPCGDGATSGRVGRENTGGCNWS